VEEALDDADGQQLYAATVQNESLLSPAAAADNGHGYLLTFRLPLLRNVETVTIRIVVGQYSCCVEDTIILQAIGSTDEPWLCLGP
jgi:hypothetical protein